MELRMLMENDSSQALGGVGVGGVSGWMLLVGC